MKACPAESINPQGSGRAGAEALFGAPISYTTLMLPDPVEADEGPA